MRGKTYYALLGITQNANISEIKRAYRRLALCFHPDRTHNEPNATDKFKEINEAYEVLSQSAQRKEYDRRCKGRGQSYSGYPDHCVPESCYNYYAPEYYNDCYEYAKASTNHYVYNYRTPPKVKAPKPKATHRQPQTTRRTRNPFSYQWNTSFVIYLAGCTREGQSGFGWAVYECNANGSPTSSDPIHDGKGCFATEDDEAAYYRGLLDALEYFRKYLSCESYYVRCDSKQVIALLQSAMESWDGLSSGDDEETMTSDYHQRSIQLLKEISSSWRRFEAVTDSENERATQNAKDALQC